MVLMYFEKASKGYIISYLKNTNRSLLPAHIMCWYTIQPLFSDLSDFDLSELSCLSTQVYYGYRSLESN